MIDFVDTRPWPLVELHMPAVIPDDRAADYLAAYAALFARDERFVLLMGGVEAPQHSPAFMAAYLAWGEANRALQRRWCAGAIRIERDPIVRQRIEARARAWHAAGKAPYPIATAPDRAAARVQGRAWLNDHELQAPGLFSPGAHDRCHVAH